LAGGDRYATGTTRAISRGLACDERHNEQGHDGDDGDNNRDGASSASSGTRGFRMGGARWVGDGHLDRLQPNGYPQIGLACSGPLRPRPVTLG